MTDHATTLRALAAELETMLPDTAGVLRGIADAYAARRKIARGLDIGPLAEALHIFMHAFESGCVDSDLLAAYNAASAALAQGEFDGWTVGQLDEIESAVRDNCGPATARRVRAVVEHIEWLRDYCARPSRGEEHLPHLRALLAALAQPVGDAGALAEEAKSNVLVYGNALTNGQSSRADEGREAAFSVINRLAALAQPAPAGDVVALEARAKELERALSLADIALRHYNMGEGLSGAGVARAKALDAINAALSNQGTQP